MEEVPLEMDSGLELSLKVAHPRICLDSRLDSKLCLARADVEAALCRSWNHWLGDIWRQSQGRLRWSCVVPSTLMDEAVRQVKTAKQNGAVAVCLRPLEEARRHLADSYFYPLYEAAESLDMAIAVHIANGNRD